MTLVSASGDSSKLSSYYQQRLVDGINAPGKIILDIRQTITDKSGIPQDVDQVHGGGVTGKLANGDVAVIISGNEHNGLRDSSGNPLKDGPADILAHEVVGHAVPLVVGPDTGNAVMDENKVRDQIPGSGQRAPEPSHKEF